MYYEQAQQILIDDLPAPFLFNLAGRALVKPYVTGITPTASEAEWPGSLSSLMSIDVVPAEESEGMVGEATPAP